MVERMNGSLVVYGIHGSLVLYGTVVDNAAVSRAMAVVF